MTSEFTKRNIDKFLLIFIIIVVTIGYYLEIKAGCLNFLNQRLAGRFYAPTYSGFISLKSDKGRKIRGYFTPILVIEGATQHYVCRRHA